VPCGFRTHPAGPALFAARRSSKSLRILDKPAQHFGSRRKFPAPRPPRRHIGHIGRCPTLSAQENARSPGWIFVPAGSPDRARRAAGVPGGTCFKRTDGSAASGSRSSKFGDADSIGQDDVETPADGHATGPPRLRRAAGCHLANHAGWPNPVQAGAAFKSSPVPSSTG